ncbi:hypothetical protein MRB53_038696 [Persea americana]|nr:hypothetical protein MRB53_038696 [Persea americana]
MLRDSSISDSSGTIPTTLPFSPRRCSLDRICAYAHLKPADMPPRLLKKARGGAALQRKEVPNGTPEARYNVLKKRRESERAQAIKDGRMADPNKPTSLADAITMVGTCKDMCPEFERLERTVQNDVWGQELGRGADGEEVQESSGGTGRAATFGPKPPHVLRKTIDYLFHTVIGEAQSLADVHHFVWDRTRAIRNDFSIQQLTKQEDITIAIECYERIARFHIVSLHQLASAVKPYDAYDAQQEREQLDKTLLSLMQYYDDNRDRLQSQNEAEFRAYCVIFQIQDPVPDLEDRVQNWPEHILKNGRVDRALKLYAAACSTFDKQGPLKPWAIHPIAQSNWRRFWSLLQSTQISYLMGCVAEIYFNLVRRNTLVVSLGVVQDSWTEAQVRLVVE